MAFQAFKDAERDGWDRRAAAYEAHTALATLQIVPAMLNALRLRPGLRLLDLACGVGHLAGAASALGCECTGLDFAPAMIASAEKRFPDVDFHVGDAQTLPFEDDVFDLVACNIGLFHMTDPAMAFAEVARVLRSGGRFSFSQWAAPAESELYGKLFSIIPKIADMSRADPAPDAYALSDPRKATEELAEAGFGEIEVLRLETALIAHGDDFFDFFMRFGVRVPLIVAAQEADVQDQLRAEINAAMADYKTPDGYEVPMPSLLYTGKMK